jgi:hypothetical protein
MKKKIKERFCRVFGHTWRYKDYTNFIKSNGDKYDFRASRNWLVCMQHAYFYDGWQNEGKSRLDYTGDYYLLNEISINSILYS